MNEEKFGRHVDWRAANLRGNQLAGLNLEHADMRGADLRDVNFTGSNLRYADLRGANVSGANFSRRRFTVRSCKESKHSRLISATAICGSAISVGRISTGP